MGEALREKSTDMVGLGRPLTAEPTLGSDLLASQTLKAKANEVPNALQTGSSVMQIHDVSLYPILVPLPSRIRVSFRQGY